MGSNTNCVTVHVQRMKSLAVRPGTGAVLPPHVHLTLLLLGGGLINVSFSKFVRLLTPATGQIEHNYHQQNSHAYVHVGQLQCQPTFV